MFTSPYRNKSSVSKPKEVRTWWGLASIVIESLFVVSMLVVVAMGMQELYQRLTSDVFFPITKIEATKSLKYGNFGEVGEIVIDHAKDNDLLRLDASKIASEIKALSWVKQARVTKIWPHTVEIDIDERVPIVRWGEHEFLDQTGYRFSVPETPELQELFVLSGGDGYEKQVLHHYQKIQPWLVLQKLPIEQFGLDPRLVWHLRLKGGIDVVLGRDHLNERLKKLVVIYRKLIQSYEQYIDLIDLRYQDGFSVRWKKGVTPSIERQKDIKKIIKGKS